MTDFVPGGDFIPGSDLVPGITDVLGIDWAPGIDFGSDSGIDWAPGIDLGQDYVPGIDQVGADQTGWGSDWLGNVGQDVLNKVKKGTAGSDTISKLLKTVKGGANTGTGTGAGAGSNVTVNTPAPFTMPNITADVVGDTQGGNAAPMFNLNPMMPAAQLTQMAPQQKFMAEGGYTESSHEPEFYSEGGIQNRYVKGDGDGTSDSVPAMLATGEFVIPADVVSALGNGDSDSGASALDEFLKSVRNHKHSNGDDELPPDSLTPLEYISKDKGTA